LISRQQSELKAIATIP